MNDEPAYRATPRQPTPAAPRPPEVLYVELLAAMEAKRVARDLILHRRMLHPR